MVNTIKNVFNHVLYKFTIREWVAFYRKWPSVDVSMKTPCKLCGQSFGSHIGAYCEVMGKKFLMLEDSSSETEDDRKASGEVPCVEPQSVSTVRPDEPSRLSVSCSGVYKQAR